MEIRIRGYGKSFNAGYKECNENWKNKILKMIEKEENKFFETRDVRYANRRKVLEELLKE